MYEKRDGNLIGCCPSRDTRVPGAGCRVPGAGCRVPGARGFSFLSYPRYFDNGPQQPGLPAVPRRHYSE